MKLGKTIWKIPFLLVLVLLSVNLIAQDNCSPTTSKKVQKILDKVYSAQKHTPREIETMLKEAVSLDEECLECRFSLARIQYQIATDYNQNYAPSLSNFDKVIVQCATYHADAYY